MSTPPRTTVMVNGIGTLGTTLVQVLAAHREALGIDEVLARKNTVRLWDVAGLELLKGLGVTVVADEYPGQVTFADVRDEVGYVFDTTAAGGALRNRPTYDAMPGLLGASGQGTEAGFGMPYALGMGIDTSEDRYVHVVSCSTHAALCVLRTLSAGRLDDIVSADFVNVRRSEDVGHHERLVGGNVLARHLDPELGTHHAIDASRVLAVLGRRVEMQSSDVTTPSQFLHATRFSLRLNESVTPEEVATRLEGEPWAATTAMFDSNKVFEAGRRFGFGGRLFSQVVFVPGNVLVKGDTVSGWAFVPQEGNTILSTLAAFLQRTHPSPDEALAEVASHLLLRAL